MGCFDSTCAFSRTSVHYGDRILWVALHPNARIEDGTYSLIRPHSSQKFRFVELGIYNYYGCVEGFNVEDGLENVRGKDWWDYQFIVHESVANGLLDKPLSDYRSLEVAANQLLIIAHQARIQVLGHNLLGSQCFDRDEVELQRKLLHLTSEVLDRKEAQLNEYEDYED